MQRLPRLVLVVLMTAVMVLMVTFIATVLNIGMRPDFLWQWGKAYVVGWPVAAGTGFLVMPAAKRLADRIMARIERMR